MEAIIPICQRIKKNGVRCGSPALRGRNYCYYHDKPVVRSANPFRLAIHTDKPIIHEAMMELLRQFREGELLFWEAKERWNLIYLANNLLG